MIKVFSRMSMIDHINLYGVSPNEYYISILPTGGPHSSPIFKGTHSNIITLIFDDVLKDCIKPHHTGSIYLRSARAMTEAQADELCRFIKKIPNGAIINIHCVEGKSRSVGIALAIENKKIDLLCNKHVYNLVKERLC